VCEEKGGGGGALGHRAPYLSKVVVILLKRKGATLLMHAPSPNEGVLTQWFEEPQVQV